MSRTAIEASLEDIEQLKSHTKKPETVCKVRKRSKSLPSGLLRLHYRLCGHLSFEHRCTTPPRLLSWRKTRRFLTDRLGRAFLLFLGDSRVPQEEAMLRLCARLRRCALPLLCARPWEESGRLVNEKWRAE